HKLYKLGRSVAQLEELLLFAILAANKGAVCMAEALARLLRKARRRTGCRSRRPFALLRRVGRPEALARPLEEERTGLHRQKARTISLVLRSGLDLRRCSREDLLRIPGVGWKTASLFLLYSRRDQRLACLDAHVLRHLRSRGVRAPSMTPGRRG